MKQECLNTFQPYLSKLSSFFLSASQITGLKTFANYNWLQHILGNKISFMSSFINKWCLRRVVGWLGGGGLLSQNDLYGFKYTFNGERFVVLTFGRQPNGNNPSYFLWTTKTLPIQSICRRPPGRHFMLWASLAGNCIAPSALIWVINLNNLTDCCQISRGFELFACHDAEIKMNILYQC